jgi:heme oxygenase
MGIAGRTRQMPVITPSSTMTRLRAETAELEHRVEAELDLFGPRTSWLDYRLYLFRMYGFHGPVERALSATPGLADVISDASLRNHKLALLAHDLVSLGVDRRDLAELPRITTPTLHDLAEALGWMYVVEAATLRSRELARHLAAQLPLEIESASAFLACYGDEVEARWSAFGAAVELHTGREGNGERVLEGALDCLGRLHRWLRPTSAHARPARVHGEAPDPDGRCPARLSG